MLKSLFKFPYYKTKIKAEKYNKNDIISSMVSNYSIEPSRNHWNPHCNLHHEYNDFGNENFQSIDYSMLIPLYASEIKNFIEELKFIEEMHWKFTIENYTVTKGSQNMLPHHHLPSTFSAVHYLKFDSSEHTSTIFHNPSQYGLLLDSQYSNQQKIFDRYDENNLWLWNDVIVDVEEDDMIIFPSILNHSIGASNSNKERITVALNIQVQRATEDGQETVH